MMAGRCKRRTRRPVHPRPTSYILPGEKAGAAVITLHVAQVCIYTQHAIRLSLPPQLLPPQTSAGRQAAPRSKVLTPRCTTASSPLMARCGLGGRAPTAASHLLTYQHRSPRQREQGAIQASPQTMRPLASPRNHQESNWGDEEEDPGDSRQSGIPRPQGLSRSCEQHSEQALRAHAGQKTAARC